MLQLLGGGPRRQDLRGLGWVQQVAPPLLITLAPAPAHPHRARLLAGAVPPLVPSPLPRPLPRTTSELPFMRPQAPHCPAPRPACLP